MGWSGESSKIPANAPFVNGGKPLDILELDPQFAQAIGIANGQKVRHATERRLSMAAVND